MLLPYRCKNPPECTPYVTYGLIALNTLIYLITTRDLLVIKDGVVADWAVSPDTAHQFYRIFTAMFLHEEPFHILGNMLFLWLFGTAVEGRLKSVKFLILYLAAGVIGQFAQLGFQYFTGNTSGFGLGASGAIMGLAGAYIYLFPHAIIVVFRIFIWFPFYFRVGPADWKAWWVIVYYMAYNVVNALIVAGLGIQGGTAFMAHIGGFTGGLLICMAFRPKRDTEMVSQIQAVRSDVKGDFEQMSLYELDSLLETPTENMDLVTAYCKKALLDGGPTGEMKCVKMLSRYRLKLVDNGDPFKIVQVVLRIPISSDTLPQVFYLKLGGRLEAMQYQDDAGLCYRRVFDMDKTSREAEIALIRLGRMLENYYHNPDQAREAYTVLIHLFPTSPAVEEAQKALRRLTPPSETAPV